MQDSVTGGCLGLGGDGEKLHLVSGSRQLKLGELYLRSPTSDRTVEVGHGCRLLSLVR
jgi:hypothetical protein